jgi:fermentation-respiration switch protein FrsA (DUF1100 family)
MITSFWHTLHARIAPHARRLGLRVVAAQTDFAGTVTHWRFTTLTPPRRTLLDYRPLDGLRTSKADLAPGLHSHGRYGPFRTWDDRRGSVTDVLSALQEARRALERLDAISLGFEDTIALASS